MIRAELLSAPRRTKRRTARAEVSELRSTLSEAMLPNVYVFTNGVKRGEGPFRLQADVFDRPPGSEGYSPLRAVNPVAWKDEGKARELRSAAEVEAAEAAGEIEIKRPGVVVNMPLLTWPGGRR